MTSVPLPRAQADRSGVQRETERMVRYLLHRVRRPYELVDVPLARAIGHALGTDNAAEALLRVLEAALPGDAPSEVRLRKLVLEYDFDSGSISQVCTTMGISRRHLLRLRSEAVTAMAYFIRKLLAAESLDFSDADDMSENQIANLAEIVANSEPEKGATIYELGGLGSSTASQLLRLRSAIDQGSGLSATTAAQFQNLPHELVRACIAFSRESNGEPASDDVPGSAATRGGVLRYTAVMKFELEYLAYLRARQRGHAFEMKTVALGLSRLAELRRSALGTALYLQADAHLRLGELGEAQRLLDQGGRFAFHRSDARQFASNILLNSKIALFEGDAKRAVDLALGACTVFTAGSRNGYQAQIALSEARLAAGAAWLPPPETARLQPCAWDRIAMDIEHGRHLGMQGRWVKAEELLSPAHLRATSLGYVGLAARAAATLSVRAAELDDAEASIRWASMAYAGLLESQDFLLGLNLFQQPLSALHKLDDRVLDVTYRRTCVLVPQLLGDDREQSEATRTLLAAILTTEAAKQGAMLDDAIARVNAADGALPHYAARAAASLEHMLALTMLALYGQRCWPGRNARLRATIEHVIESLRPGPARNFIIG